MQQTFLPYADFAKSAAHLTDARLDVTRGLVHRVLLVLAGGSPEWADAPLVEMWRGYERALISYGVAICNEWVCRGHTDGTKPVIQAFAVKFDDAGDPPWLGDEGLHASHRSNLLRIDPAHYGVFRWGIPDDLPFVWPVSERGGAGGN